MIDTHAHLTDLRFNEDLDTVINNAYNNNIQLIINNTSNINDSIISVSIAENHKNIFSTFGIHPLDAIEITDAIINIFEKYLPNPKIVAIGEIGLDYHYSSETKKLQKKILEIQLNLAEKFNLPVTIHGRDAERDTIEIVKNFNLKGVFHCFAGSVTELKEILDMGYYIGFDGPITFKKNQEFIDLLEYTPIDRILCETDSPYLTPVPMRGKRNEPLYVKYVYEKISLLKNIPIEELILTVYNNTLNLFTKILKEN